ncbi:MAG: galactose oxidase [Kangiellaceae bacterium]|nr:galactose oxidase [Kangiellaceae bacterium]
MRYLLLFTLLTLIACQDSQNTAPLKLSNPISNNAVALADIDGDSWIYSFNGLLPGKTWHDVSSKAYAVNIKSGESITLNSVPGAHGRLASVAATVDNKIYIFGGYTVAEDHSEISTAEVYRFDPKTHKYDLVTRMPTPVDDSVALVYQDRYIYLVSGWYNNGNVDLVQILDTHDMSWHIGTPFPGSPVFGHAAGIVTNKFIISDGVKVIKVTDGKRHYGMSDENYLAEIDQHDFKKIEWKKLANHPGPARYRMAATGSKGLNKVIFVGGSDNPYNYNGIGYNGTPSQPHNLIFAYDFATNQWQELGKQETATMDHRALLETNQQFYVVGGMLNNQQTTYRIFNIKL